jgi:hypothetical protein
MNLVLKFKAFRMGGKKLEPLKRPPESARDGNSEFKDHRPEEGNLHSLPSHTGKMNSPWQMLFTGTEAFSERGKGAGIREGGNGIGLPTFADKRLLESFPVRKNAELKEYFKKSEISDLPDEIEDRLNEIFALTRSLLRSTVGPLNTGFIQNDVLLEKALWKVHGLLPLPMRLIVGKKRFIQLLLDNRDHLIP